MTHVIFDECIRDGACVDVCPVECIIPGIPEDDWPWYYIDPETCIDCGACIPECPTEAILPEEDLAEDQEFARFTFDVIGKMSEPVAEMMIELGEMTDDGEAVLVSTTKLNEVFFTEGPSYEALDLID